MTSPSFLETPPRIAAMLAIVWAAAVVVTHSDAGVPFTIWIFLMGSGILLVAWWALRLAMSVFRDRSRLRASVRIWLIVPASVAVAFLATATPVFVMLRLYLSSGALIRGAPALARADDNDLFSHPRRVGLYRVRQFSSFDNELRFLTNDCGFVDNCGFVFSPTGPPPNRGEDSFTHLYGNWWHWHQSW